MAKKKIKLAGIIDNPNPKNFRKLFNRVGMVTGDASKFTKKAVADIMNVDK